MTMLDQLRQIFSPTKDISKTKRKSSSSSSENKFGRLKTNRKKNEKKPVIEERKPYLDPDACHHRTSGLDLVNVIRKPSYVDSKEWIATHTISLFHNVNHLYGSVSEFCTAETCPVMQGPCQTHFTWLEERGKKLKCTAPQYVDYVMTFCQKCVSNQELFPTKYAQNFSDNFLVEIKKMLRFLFHVISHLYYAHFLRIRQLDLHVYLNTIFKHYTYFVREFNLVELRETASLDDLVSAMGLYSPSSNSEGSPSTLNASHPSRSAIQLTSSTQTLRSRTYSRGNGSTSGGLNAFHSWSAST